MLLAPLLPRRAGDRATNDRVTIVEREGVAVAASAVGLVAAAAVPFLLRKSAWYKNAQRLSAAALAIGVLLTITTVGLFFIPSMSFMLLAASRRPPRDPFG
ncbi:MAG: hypothetical protein HYU28_11015 [Actinobacteria bacterium]|nr:hypothetical protein [Actinomycetota bacterium]